MRPPRSCLQESRSGGGKCPAKIWAKLTVVNIYEAALRIGSKGRAQWGSQILLASDNMGCESCDPAPPHFRSASPGSYFSATKLYFRWGRNMRPLSANKGTVREGVEKDSMKNKGKRSWTGGWKTLIPKLNSTECRDKMVSFTNDLLVKQRSRSKWLHGRKYK